MHTREPFAIVFLCNVCLTAVDMRVCVVYKGKVREKMNGAPKALYPTAYNVSL